MHGSIEHHEEFAPQPMRGCTTEKCTRYHMGLIFNVSFQVLISVFISFFCQGDMFCPTWLPVKTYCLGIFCQGACFAWYSVTDEQIFEIIGSSMAYFCANIRSRKIDFRAFSIIVHIAVTFLKVDKASFFVELRCNSLKPRPVLGRTPTLNANTK